MSLLQAGFGSSGGDYTIDDSLRFRSSASAYLSRTPSSTSDRTEWTWSGWVKKGPNATNLGLFSADHAGGSNAYLSILINNSDEFQIFEYTGSAYTLRLATNALFRDPSAWYHFVCAVDTDQGTDTNRIKLYVNGVQQTSLRLSTYPSSGHTTYVNVSGNLHAVGATVGASTSPERYLDGYLTEVNFIDGQQLTPTDFGEYDANGTWKAKEYTGTYGTNGFYLPMKPTTQADGFNTVLYTGTGDSQSIDGVGYAPDLVWTKSRSNAQNHELYDSVRGVQKYLLVDASTAEGTATGGLASFDTDGFSVGNSSGSAVNISGQSLVAWTWDAGDNQTSTGISSVLYSGSGTRRKVTGFGFSPDLVWIKNRLAANFHYLYDSVRGVQKSLSTNSTGAEDGYPYQLEVFDSDGFTVGDDVAGYNNYPGRNYIAWAWDAGDGDPVSNTDGDITSTVKANDATGFSIVSYTGNGTSNSEQTIGHGLSTAPKVVIVKDRTSASTRWTFYSTDLSSDATYAVKNLLLNSTAAESAYSSQIRGIQGSNTFSVRDVDANGNANVNKSGDNYIAYCFSEVSGVSKFSTYTGTGSSGKAITGLGFRPGFLMIKEISSTGNWAIVDGTRSPFGEVTGDYLYANLAQAEGGGSAPLQFDSDGFTINSGDSDTNASGQTYLYMAFKGSYSDYVSPLNETGTIDTRVKANDAYGFSIASYIGNGSNSTIGHGLSAAPDLAIFKNRDDGNDDWWTYNSISGATKFLRLNTSAALGTSSVVFNDTEPTSTVFTIGTGSAINTNGDNHIAYFFRSVTGYSKIGSYTGTGTTTGNVTTVGFRPAFLMVKGTSLTSNWVILDNTRDPNPDPAKNVLMPDNTNADTTAATGLYTKFTDTGFQPVGTGTDTNSSGATYIYMAIADTTNARFNFDASGNKNNWLPNNINSNAESETTYDLMKDTPSLVDENAGNFATLNPLKNYNNTLADGNLNISASSASTTTVVLATIGVSSGKWYWEYMQTSTTGADLCLSGLARDNVTLTATQSYIGMDSNGWGYYGTGWTYHNAVANQTYGATYGNNDVIGVAFDADAGTLVFYKNGVSQGTAYTGLTSGPYFPAFGDGGSTTNIAQNVNFGQQPFKYTPPTGFLKLNTFNLPDSTIEKGDDYFNTVLWTGNTTTNGVQQAITGVGFQPDFVWAKTRNQAFSHYLYDSVRGVGSSGKLLQSNNTNAEATNVEMDSFDTDGFTVEYGSTQVLNWSSSNNVGWSWKASGTTASNTDGSVTSTVSVNTTAGFSIVGFTAPSGTGNFSAGHGLGVTPAMVIVKTRDSGSAPWYVWQNTFSNLTDDYMRLNATNAKQTQTSGWGAGMTSSVIGLKAGSTTVATENHIAYCFAEVEGYSAFGSYTGNGSTDGPFVYTGFRPAFVMVKVTAGAIYDANWFMLDSARGTYNVNKPFLAANNANAENSGATCADFLSNGFKLRITNSLNDSNATYIYMAFAENPFKNANAR